MPWLMIRVIIVLIVMAVMKQMTIDCLIVTTVMRMTELSPDCDD